MTDSTKRRMQLEKKHSDRFGMSYGGVLVGTWDTARQMLEGYRSYENKIRPIVDRAMRHRFIFWKDRESITLQQLTVSAGKEVPRSARPRRKSDEVHRK